MDGAKRQWLAAPATTLLSNNKRVPVDSACVLASPRSSERTHSNPHVYTHIDTIHPQVTELTPEETENPLGGYGRTVAHVVIGGYACACGLQATSLLFS